MEQIEATLWVPVIRAVGDVAKMMGYPVGWLWRIQHRNLIAHVKAQKGARPK
jgi:hypothetical protein